LEKSVASISRARSNMAKSRWEKLCAPSSEPSSSASATRQMISVSLAEASIRSRGPSKGMSHSACSARTKALLILRSTSGISPGKGAKRRSTAFESSPKLSRSRLGAT